MNAQVLHGVRCLLMFPEVTTPLPFGLSQSKPFDKGSGRTVVGDGHDLWKFQ
jgi:hypothetical protein